jgi:hypothetical protein
MTSVTQIDCLPSRKNDARRLALIILTIAPFSFGGLALMLGQDASWDFRNYHWYNAYSFLNGRENFDFLPAQWPSLFNPLIDVPFYISATHISPIIAAYILGFVQGLNFVLLFILAYSTLIISPNHRKVIVCAALATLGMLGAEGLGEIGMSFGDNIISLGIFFSAILVVKYFDALLHLPQPRAFTLAVLFGVPAGAMMGLKLTAALFCLGLCGAIFFTIRPLTRKFSISFAFGIGVLAGFTLIYGYWAWFLQTHWGSPFFPFFNSLFKSPFAPQADVRMKAFLPKSIAEYVFYPFIFAKYPFRVSEIWWRDWRLTILYGLLPFALILRLGAKQISAGRALPQPISRPQPTTYLLWMGTISYFVWLIMYSIHRYAVPLEMLAPILIVLAAGLLPLKPQKRWLLAGGLIFVTALSLHYARWGRVKGWGDHMVEANVPPLGDTSNLMILMAGTMGYSYLIPQFPSEIPFVRIQSYENLNKGDLAQTKEMDNLIRTRLDSHKGRFLILFCQEERDMVSEGLKQFGFEFGGPCQTIVERLNWDHQPTDLCPVIRSPSYGRKN